MINVDDRVLDKLSNEGIALMMVLASYGKTFRKSTAELSARMKWGEKKLPRIKKELIRHGIIKVTRSYNDTDLFEFTTSQISWFFGKETPQKLRVPAKRDPAEIAALSY